MQPVRGTSRESRDAGCRLQRRRWWRRRRRRRERRGSRGGDDDDGVAGVGWWWWYKTVCHSTAYRNAKLLRHRQRGRPGPVAGFKARSSQVELPNARALYFSLSLTPTSRAHTRRMKFCLGRDRDRLISNEHECMADGPESASDREFIRATYYISRMREKRWPRAYTLSKICPFFNIKLDLRHIPQFEEISTMGLNEFCRDMYKLDFFFFFF